jgi:hypothetical protein
MRSALHEESKKIIARPVEVCAEEKHVESEVGPGLDFVSLPKRRGGAC